MLTTRSTLALTVLVAAAPLALGCSTGADGGGTGPDLTGIFTVAAEPAFAGGEVRVHGADFRGAADSTIRVTLGSAASGTALASRRVDDTTFAVALPDTAHGATHLGVAIGAHSTDLAAVTVHGFESAFRLGPGGFGDLLAYEQGGHAVALGISNPDHRATAWSLDTRTATSFGPALNTSYMQGLGTSYRPGVFLLEPETGSTTAQAWALAPTPHLESEHPSIGNWLRTEQLGSDRWLIVGPQFYWMRSRTDSSQPYADATPVTGSGYGALEFSPRGDRATIRGAMPGGVPVFDLASGGLAYQVPAMYYAYGADFSPDGEFLAIGGQGYEGAQGVVRNLAVVRATTGEVAHDTLFAGAVRSVAFDPAYPLLYVVADSAKHTVVHVLSRTDFHVVGRLALPAGAARCGADGADECEADAVLARSAEPALYLARGSGTGLYVRRYTLPATFPTGMP